MSNQKSMSVPRRIIIVAKMVLLLALVGISISLWTTSRSVELLSAAEKKGAAEPKGAAASKSAKKNAPINNKSEVVGKSEASAKPEVSPESAQWIEKQVPELFELYKHFHQNPELSLQEEKTAAKVAAELKQIGAEVTTGVGGYGVVALLKNGPGPTLMIRTDLDALPVKEMTELVYSSQVKVKDPSGAEVGVMHACGHDIHMTCLLGTARFLAAHKDQWRGTVMFIGQPAEERGMGAKNMLDDGLFTKFPKPDCALALHVDSTLESGKVGYRAGYTLANVDSVDITVKGKGGHGAYPHTTVDPIVQAAQLILELQTIVSREIAPIDPSVITVGSIKGGSKHNIIGDSCHLQLTVRSYKDSVRKHLHEAIRRKAKAVAQGARAPEPEIVFSEGTPATYNDDALVAKIAPVFKSQLGEKNVKESEPSMGGEDFSQYGLAGVPIFMYRLGSVEQSRLNRFMTLGADAPSLHSPHYYPDAELTIQTGVTTMSAAALNILKPGETSPEKPAKKPAEKGR